MITGPRAHLVSTAATAAQTVLDLVQLLPVQPGRRYPIQHVCAKLAEQHQRLIRAVDTYRHPIALDETGQPDQLGHCLACLLAGLTYVTVYYRALGDIPPVLREQLVRHLGALHADATSLLAAAAAQGRQPE